MIIVVDALKFQKMTINFIGNWPISANCSLMGRADKAGNGICGDQTYRGNKYRGRRNGHCEDRTYRVGHIGEELNPGS